MNNPVISKNEYIVLKHKINNLSCEFILKDRFFNGMVENTNYHFHSLFEIHICVKGSMHILIEDNSFFLSEGEICIIPPHITHSVLKTEGSFCSGIRFNYTNSGKSKDSDYAFFNKAYGGLKKAIVVKNSNIYSKYLSVASSCISEQKPSFEPAYLIFIALYELADIICNDSICFENEYSDTAVSECIEDYLNLNYSKKITLDDISLHLNLGKRQVQRIVKKLFGMTFTELLNKKRLSTAKLLLKTSDLSVEKISVMCGFEDKNYFYRRFSASFGITPGKYRNSFN